MWEDPILRDAEWEVLEKLGFEALKDIPSVLRHKVRPVVVSVHVNDELIVGKKGQESWLVKELQKFFELTVEGPYRSERGSREQLHHLKRTYEFVERKESLCQSQRSAMRSCEVFMT